MESSDLLGECLSPESTVTSLLSSSGHLRSSFRPDESSFTYRDKVYDSASEALDAYISDFERSRQLTGTIGIHQTFPAPGRLRLDSLRNKDVLRERLTEKELDFLNLPVSSLHHRSNRDRASMTTDELLAIPHDGTEPVTHTSAFLQGLLSQSGVSQLHPSSSSLRPPGVRISSSHHHSLPPSGPTRNCRCRNRARESTAKPGVTVASLSSFECAHTPARSPWGVEASSSLHLPHWLTSHRADVDGSGISSLPDLRHPAWVQTCELSQPDPRSQSWEKLGLFPSAPSKPEAPSWVADLEEEEDDPETPVQMESQMTLRDLRLQFAEHISLQAAKRQGHSVAPAPHTDGRLESLIRKADQVLTSLSQSGAVAESPARPESPGNTDEPWDRPPFPRDAAPVDSTQTDGDVQEGSGSLGGSGSGGSGSRGSGSWKQPGPAEALKQMLFRLQHVEAELQRRQRPAAPADGQQTPEKQWSDVEPELQSVPGRPSLQRALFHLNRLKLLVEEPAHSREDEDEGRYSSSSADVLVCSRQGTS